MARRAAVLDGAADGAAEGAGGTGAAGSASRAELVLRLRLIRSRRVGPVTYHRLLSEHGSAAAALAALPGIARAAGVEGYAPCPVEVAEQELTLGRLAGARLLTHDGPGYPEGMRDLPDAPPLLWARGDVALLSRPLVAMVGARNASSLGLRMARRLAETMGEAGQVVVSGLARGIDAEAHRAALATGTVAVMAGGVDVVYPEENVSLLAEIAARGCVVSEQPMGLVPQARHFPLRNRIIAGLSRAVVVVEAAARSGSLITAREALDMGREVMAVPGHPFDARAAGCNHLIRDGATLVRGTPDVLEALGARTGPAAVADGYGPDGYRPDGSGPDVLRPEGGKPEGGKPEGGKPDRGKPDGSGREEVAKEAASPYVGQGSGLPGPVPARRPLTDMAHLHGLILNRLGPSPTAEDQLIRDLALPAAEVTPELVALELDGKIHRAPGGMLSRL